MQYSTTTSSWIHEFVILQFYWTLLTSVGVSSFSNMRINQGSRPRLLVQHSPPYYSRLNGLHNVNSLLNNQVSLMQLEEGLVATHSLLTSSCLVFINCRQTNLLTTQIRKDRRFQEHMEMSDRPLTCSWPWSDSYLDEPNYHLFLLWVVTTVTVVQQRLRLASCSCWLIAIPRTCAGDKLGNRTEFSYKQVDLSNLIKHIPVLGICGGQSGAGVGFLRVLRFPLPIFIPPISPSS
jgi:hypothetical protein